ncbi:hypothetical protein MSA03_22260 [Microbacterium saccharophilum]|nr:hypothetical protein MSA03_22260 [Microbacterium saccharophilum]
MTRPARVGSERPIADTMPAVTLPETARVPERDDELPHAEGGRIAEPHGRWGRAVGAQHREVGEGVGPDDGGRGHGAVVERELHGDGAFHDVRARQEVPLLRDDRRAPGARPLARAHAHRRDRRQHRLGDAHDRRGVGVERFLVVHVTSVDLSPGCPGASSRTADGACGEDGEEGNGAGYRT